MSEEVQGEAAPGGAFSGAYGRKVSLDVVKNAAIKHGHTYFLRTRA